MSPTSSSSITFDIGTPDLTPETPPPSPVSPNTPVYGMLNLPPEILLMIVAHSSTSTLAALSLTSRPLHTLLNPLLADCFAAHAPSIARWAVENSRTDILSRVVSLGTLKFRVFDSTGPIYMLRPCQAPGTVEVMKLCEREALYCFKERNPVPVEPLEFLEGFMASEWNQGRGQPEA